MARNAAGLWLIPSSSNYPADAEAQMRDAATALIDVQVLGIATALAHTFLGLFLAIPTLAAFGILRTQVDRLTTRAAIVSEELLQLIKSSQSETPKPMPAAPPATVLPPRPTTIGR